MARIWLDDVRPAPEGYIWCHSVNKAKFMITALEAKDEAIELIDCDHDMGEFAKKGGDGMKLLDWLIERNTLYRVHIHSMNGAAAERMRQTIKRHWPIKDQ